MVTQNGVGLSQWLIEQIALGKAILFLGAGSSKDARGINGESPPDSNSLRDILCDEFLEGNHKEDPLAQVAEFCKSTASSRHVYEKTRDIFLTCKPGKAHMLVPAFSWKAIVSTNYDLLIEDAYSNHKTPAQKLIPVVRDEQLQAALQTPNAVPLIKLHGCINHIQPNDPPLILATEEYAGWQNNRQDLFGTFQEWLTNTPVIFCGYRLNSDAHITNIFWQTGHSPANRSHCAIVDPTLRDYALDYWQRLRVTPLSMTFSEFIEGLTDDIPENQRALGRAVISDKHPLRRHIPSSEPIPDDIVAYIDHSIDLIRRNMSSAIADPRRFYSGYDLGWSGIVSGLNLTRSAEKDLISDIESFWLDPKHNRFNILVGPAGAGKTISCRAIAFEISQQDLMPVLWIGRYQAFSVSTLVRLIALIDGPLLLVVEDALTFSQEIEDLLLALRDSNSRIYILSAARSNEWAMASGSLSPYVDREHQLRRLSENEIRRLLELLESTGSLGNLESLSRKQRFVALKDYCQRQILVALHQATKGEPLEKIVEDEYQRIQPLEAQSLYLDICCIHSLNVGARAGLISRVSGVNIEQFQERFFAPLEEVVNVYHSSRFADFVYTSRHPEIARLVIQRILTSPNHRAARLARIIQHMNLSYQSDQTAFEQLVKGRALAKYFAAREDAELIMRAARETNADPGYLNHQFAVFEMKHGGGSLNTALRLVDQAINEYEYRTPAVFHTKGNIYRLLAKDAEDSSKFEILSAEAERIFRALLPKSNTAATHSTLAALYTERIKRLMEIDADTDLAESKELPILIERLQLVLSEGEARFPKDGNIRLQSARFHELVGKSEKVIAILTSALENDRANGIIASSLAMIYHNRGESEEAVKTIHNCLDVNPQSREANFAYARILLESNNESDIAKDAIGALNRVFSIGDSNIEAQALCARLEYLFGDRSRARKIFDALKNLKLSPFNRSRIRNVHRDPTGRPLTFEGTVRRLEEQYAFLDCEQLGDSIYASKRHNAKLWNQLQLGNSVKFKLGFSLLGTVAIIAPER